MFNRAMILAGLVGVAGVFPVAAFGQAIDGIVRGPDGKALKDVPMEELDRYWEAAKRNR